jgi:hypothetical protein
MDPQRQCTNFIGESDRESRSLNHVSRGDQGGDAHGTPRHFELSGGDDDAPSTAKPWPSKMTKRARRCASTASKNDERVPLLLQPLF